MCKLTIIATYKENVISAKTQSGGTIETLTCYGAGICNVICFLYSFIKDILYIWICI